MSVSKIHLSSTQAKIIKLVYIKNHHPMSFKSVIMSLISVFLPHIKYCSGFNVFVIEVVLVAYSGPFLQ